MLTDVDRFMRAGIHRVLTNRELRVFLLIGDVMGRAPRARKWAFDIKAEAPAVSSEASVCRGLSDLEHRGLVTLSYSKASRPGPPQAYVSLNKPNLQRLLDREGYIMSACPVVKTPTRKAPKTASKGRKPRIGSLTPDQRLDRLERVIGLLESRLF